MFIDLGSHISLSWFSCGSSILVELEFGVLFSGGRKTGVPGEKPSEQGENQQQTQPTYDTGPQWWGASVLTTGPTLLPNKQDCI